MRMAATVADSLIHKVDDEALQTEFADDRLLQVTQNLYVALRHIRPDLLSNVEDGALLWIDAICINQTDEDEKSWQVQQMLYIYRNALNPLVWLGPGTDGSAEFMDEMDASFNKYTTWVCGHQNVDIYHWDLNKEVNNLLGAASFVRQPYWRRGFSRRSMLSPSSMCGYIGVEKSST